MKKVNNVLDLHGVRHKDVKLTVYEFLDAQWENPDEIFEVITGHSTRMKDLVKEAVEDYCATFDLWNPDGLGEVFESQGIIKIEMNDDYRNFIKLQRT